MTAHEAEVRRLADLREAARRAGDYTTADELRGQIARAGFQIVDTADGPVLRPIAGSPPPAPPAATGSETLDPEVVTGPLEAASTTDVSIHWLVEGWPGDIERGIRSFERVREGRSIQHLVVDVVGTGSIAGPEEVELVHLEPGTGWAAARNAGLLRSRGRMVIVVDGSVEADGDVLAPLEAALEDTSVGVTGPFGIVSDDLREFRDTPGPECDAVESYLMAFRRELLLRGVRFDPKFRFYRTADIEFSFQVKALRLRATVTDLPVIRHEHRMWANTSEEERARLSKRNFYRFLDRWRGRSDLLVSRGGMVPREPGPGPVEGRRG